MPGHDEGQQEEGHMAKLAAARCNKLPNSEFAGRWDV
jgi:hypothetical protein